MTCFSEVQGSGHWRDWPDLKGMVYLVSDWPLQSSDLGSKLNLQKLILFREANNALLLLPAASGI